MELTYDEIWSRMTAAKTLGSATGDPLVRSAIPVLAKVLQRAEMPEGPIPLTAVEAEVVDGIAAMEEAYFTLYGRRVS